MKKESFGTREQMLKHGDLASKYRGKDSSISTERDEDMFEAATTRAEDQLKRDGLASKDISGASTREAINRKDMEARFEEAAIPEMEVMTANEMRDQMVAKHRDLSSKVSALEAKSREMSKKVREMGAVVNDTTRAQIDALEQKQKALIALHQKTLKPLFQENFVAIGRGEELLVPKPEEWDSLMSDDEYVLELGPSMQKRKSSIELEIEEAKLREGAKQIEQKIDKLIDETHAKPFFANQDMAEHFLTTESRKIAEAYIGDLYKELRTTSEKIRDIELNLGMARRLES